MRNFHEPWGHLVIWEFRVSPGAEQRFEQAYGPGGRWAQFFQQDTAYAGTELNRDVHDPQRYVTLDFWSSREAYDGFRREHQAEYQAIDRECEELTDRETEVASLTRIVFRSAGRTGPS